MRLTRTGIGRAAALMAALWLGGPVAAATGAGGVTPTPAMPAPTQDQPDCVGRDLLAELPPDRRAEIDAAVAATPYAQGTRWTATRGDARIEIIGTYHFDDPRHDPVIAELTPVIAGAGALMVEAGPEEEARITQALKSEPDLMIDPTGPTLPERLDAQDWKQLSQAMADRGIPAIMVSRMRPWYVSMMLGISPCMIDQIKTAGAVEGLDRDLMAVAEAAGTPVHGLEPWDTVLTLFAGLTPEQELDMIRGALPGAILADDYAHTTIEAYFRGDIWAIWQFMRLDAEENSGLDRAEVDRQIALAEERMMVARNAAWIEPLTQAADEAAVQGKPIVAAFGALHLPGDKGVLRLLERDGWTITKGPAP